MTHALNNAASPPSARRGTVVAALAVAIGLGLPAAWIAGKSAGGLEPKHAARLDAGQVEKREIVFYPRERAADDSIRNFKPGKAWAVETSPTFEPTPIPVAQDKGPTVAKAKLAAAPRPPVRPTTFALATPTKAAPAEFGPRYADLPADRRVESGNGFRVSNFVPTGADVVKRIGGLGETMRDSLGSVGSSLGKLMRISSR